MRKALLALLIAVTSKVLTDEAKEWMLWLPGKLIRWASKQFRDDYRARIEEEWLAHSEDLPGNFGKVLHALGCVATAFKVTDALSRTALVIIVVPIVEIEAPVVVGVFLLVEAMGLFDVGE